MPADQIAPPTPLSTAKAGVVHLGLGAFYRAHGALYIQRAMQKSGGDWRIIGVSLQSPTIRDALAPQNFVYHCVEQSPSAPPPQAIDVLANVLVAREDPSAVLRAMSDPAIRLVTLTVTEKGYCHHPATGKLNTEHPDIIHDLANPDEPRSSIGYLVQALAYRRAAGHPPFTAISCDNLPQNGRVLRGLVLEFASLLDGELAEWIADEGAFPACMVDRIVPATTPADIAALKAQGIDDRAPVMHEPFSQWVIEDNFVDGPRPDFAAAGAQLVSDVTPYEHMKLRMLNGTHSALAYLGYLAGYETIADTVADPLFTRFVRKLWLQEIAPVLTTAPRDVDLGLYAKALYERYQNPSIRHRTWQIAMDGSQKLPQRIFSTWAENYSRRQHCPGLSLAIAAWMCYVSGRDLAGNAIDVRDPLAPELARRMQEGPEALLEFTAIFPIAFATIMRPDLLAAYDNLQRLGVKGAIEEALA